LGIWLPAVVALLGGCRHPSPVYDRVPDPISMRDVVRVERGGLAWAPYLSEPELIAVEAILDRHQQAFAELRATELDAFLRDLPTEEPPPSDRAQATRIVRHRHLLKRIAALDEEACDDIAAALGPERSEFVARLRAARRLARTNAVVIADGGAVLLDLRRSVDRLRLDDETRRAVEPVLRIHEESAARLIDAVLDAQTWLPLAYRDVLARSGPPESEVPEGLDQRARDEAIHRATLARIRDARRALDAALRAYHAEIDATVERIAEVAPEEARRLRLVVLRQRAPDNPTASAERLAYELLIASRAVDATPELRRRLAELHGQIASSESRWLAELDRLAASRRDEHEGGREEAWLSRLRVAAGERAATIERVREAYEAEAPTELRATIAGLAHRESRELPEALAAVVGAERVRALLAERPVGFGDREPRRQERTRDGGPGDFNGFLPRPPERSDLERLARRADLDNGARLVAASIFAAQSDRWDAERAESVATFERLLADLGGLGGDPTPEDIDRGLRRLIGAMAERRGVRAALDRALLEDLTAALPAKSDAGLALWRLERAEEAIHLDWDFLRASEHFRMPPLARTAFFAALADAELDATDEAALIAGVVEREAAFVDAGARLRDAALEATRWLFVREVEMRAASADRDGSPDAADPAVQRMLAPVRDAAARFGVIQVELLDACAAVLSGPGRRRLRERVAAKALPQLVEPSAAETPLLELTADPTLDAARRRALAEVRATLDERRDAALEPILARASLPIDPDPTGLRDGVVIAARFARREADARALRRAWAILDDEQRARHAGLLAALDEEPRRVRGYE
jgi:hypothetical protein